MGFEIALFPIEAIEAYPSTYLGTTQDLVRSDPAPIKGTICTH